MEDYFSCILMDGSVIDFDKLCNAYVHNDGFVRFNLVCTETDKGIILQEINEKEISRIIHYFTGEMINDLYKKESEICLST